MARKRLSVWKQVQAIRHQHPTFETLERTRDRARWQGIVRPFEAEYRVHILLDIQRIPCRIEVTVVEPKLRHRNCNPNEPIPHIYKNRTHPDLPILCLFDPQEDDWGNHKSIANTIIPWTIEWLACYEGWLATGEWTGGGRHE